MKSRRMKALASSKKLSRMIIERKLGVDRKQQTLKFCQESSSRPALGRRSVCFGLGSLSMTGTELGLSAICIYGTFSQSEAREMRPGRRLEHQTSLVSVRHECPTNRMRPPSNSPSPATFSANHERRQQRVVHATGQATRPTSSHDRTVQ